MMNKGSKLYVGYKNRQVISKKENLEGGGREEIIVFSLKHGTGSSYVAAAIANHIQKRGKSIAVVTEDTEFSVEYLHDKVKRSTWNELDGDIYSGTQYVVYDAGVYDEFDSEKTTLLQRATKKVLLCHADGWYLQLLADYVETSGGEDVIYLFNNVPVEWEGKVYELMDFTNSVFILPTFYVKGDGASDIFHHVLRKRG